jgi:hypothetical protein
LTGLNAQSKRGCGEWLNDLALGTNGSRQSIFADAFHDV